MKQVKQYKHIILVVIIILLFSLFIYFYLRKTSYELEYTIDDFKVLEKYDKELETYYFSIFYKDKTYNLVSLDKYSNKRRLIEEITVTENNEDTCLSFKTTDINLYNICSNDDGYYLENINQTSELNIKDTYENISIGDIDDATYMLWNYHDFIYLNKGDHKKITLFNTDIYNLSLTYAYDNYLIIPDYEQDFIYDNVDVINTNNGKINNIKLRFEVYFNSYFMGDYKNRVYLYDLRENQEYYIDMKKEEIYKTDREILVDGDWQNVSNQTIQSEKPTFSEKSSVNYVLLNNSLYQSILNAEDNNLVSNRFVSVLVKVNGMDVYYISDDTLYKYNPYDGEVALLKYSEWNFNYQNMVFIF